MHYIAIAGLHGCMPAYCASAESEEGAVSSLADTYDLSRRLTKELRETYSVELSLRRHGVEYAEITECSCDDPTDHDDC